MIFFNQHFLSISLSFFLRIPCDISAEYSSLLEMLTENQHLILIDLARTFPTHRFYKDGFGEGQLSLFNVLKAYSILDPEVSFPIEIEFTSIHEICATMNKQHQLASTNKLYICIYIHLIHVSFFNNCSGPIRLAIVRDWRSYLAFYFCI